MLKSSYCWIESLPNVRWPCAVSVTTTIRDAIRDTCCYETACMFVPFSTIANYWDSCKICLNIYGLLWGINIKHALKKLNYQFPVSIVCMKVKNESSTIKLSFECVLYKNNNLWASHSIGNDAKNSLDN